MFNNKTIISLLIVTHFSVSISGKLLDKIKGVNKRSKDDSKGDTSATGKYEDQKVAKAPKLTPDQIEFAKNFYKNLNAEQKRAEAGAPLNHTAKGMRVAKPGADNEDKSLRADQGASGKKKGVGPATSENKGRIKRSPGPPHLIKSAPGGAAPYKSVPSGGAIIFDSFTSNLFPVGDPYSGMPDSIPAAGKWCVEVFIKGFLSIMYTLIRWPHKIASKVIAILSISSWVPNTIIWCLNPYILLKFVAKSKIINKKFDELAEIQYKTKVRLANTIDKIHNLKEISKQVCCMYMAWKRESIAAVDAEAREFLGNFFKIFIQINSITLCGEITDNIEDCADVQFLDEEPMRVIPRGVIPLAMEMFAKFF